MLKLMMMMTMLKMMMVELIILRMMMMMMVKLIMDDDDGLLSSGIYGSSPSRDDKVVPHKTNHPVLRMPIIITLLIINNH